jgi:hypothetical protein
VAVVTGRVLLAAALAAVAAAFALGSVVDFAMPWPLAARMGVAAAVLVPIGVLLGMGLPGGMRLLHSARPEIVAWGWGMNGAFSVVGATGAIFIAMNWGFLVTLLAGALTYVLAAGLLALNSTSARSAGIASPAARTP